MGLSLIFFGLSAWDYSKREGGNPLARRAWLRVALMFALVGILLYVMHMFYL